MSITQYHAVAILFPLAAYILGISELFYNEGDGTITSAAVCAAVELCTSCMCCCRIVHHLSKGGYCAEAAVCAAVELCTT